jgi:hypothetical protein
MIRLPAKPARPEAGEAVGRAVDFQPLPRFRLDLMTPGKRQPRRRFYQKLF